MSGEDLDFLCSVLVSFVVSLWVVTILPNFAIINVDLFTLIPLICFLFFSFQSMMEYELRR